MHDNGAPGFNIVHVYNISTIKCIYLLHIKI